MEYNFETADFSDYADFMNRELGESGEFLNTPFDKLRERKELRIN